MITRVSVIRVRLHARNSLFCTIAVLTALGGAATRADVVAFTSQTRFVETTTNGTPPVMPPLPVETLRQDAPDFGPFNGVASINLVPEALQSVKQTSSMTATADGATISDQSSFNGSISYNALPGESYFNVIFTLTEPAPFTATYAGIYGDARFLAQDGTIVNGQFTGPGAPGLLAPADPREYVPGSLLSFSGILQPGAFQIVADLNALNAFPNAGYVNLTVNIGPAVPVPSAAWAVVAMLPLLGLSLGRFRTPTQHHFVAACEALRAV